MALKGEAKTRKRYIAGRLVEHSTPQFSRVCVVGRGLDCLVLG
jgi:hypothetical protein